MGIYFRYLCVIPCHELHLWVSCPLCLLLGLLSDVSNSYMKKRVGEVEKIIILGEKKIFKLSLCETL